MKGKKGLCLLLTTAILSGASACGTVGNEIKTGSKGSEKETAVFSDEKTGDITTATADFSINLLKQVILAREGAEGIIISPVSVMCSLALAESGASGKTLEELEQVLGGGMSAKQYRRGLYDFLQTCKKASDSQFLSEQSIWINGDVKRKLQPEFLSNNNEWTNALLTVLPFDENASDAINDWVRKNTGGEIIKLVEQIPEDAAMYAVDATRFEGAWEEPYGTVQVIEDQTFYTADGRERAVTMLSGTQPYYVHLKGGFGFVKSYEGGVFDFVAILPPKDMPIQDYLDSITGNDIMDAYKNRKNDKIVYTQMPEAAFAFEHSLNIPLQAMGIQHAFSQDSGFEGIFSDHSPVWISQVLHKVNFELDRNGTKAASATVVEMLETASKEESREVLELILDRPFLFEIVETSSGIPVFLGLASDIAE